MASEPMRSAARLRILICLTVLSDALRLGNEDDVKEDLAARADTISFLHRTHSGDIRDLPWMNASTEPWSFYFKATCPYAQGIFKMLRRHDALLAFVNRTSMRCFSGFDDEPPSLLTPGGTPRSEAEGEALNPLGFACDKFYSEGEQTVMKELKDAHNGTVDASCRGPDISSTTSPVLKVGETTYCRPATILDWLESNIQNLKTEPLSTLATRNQTSTSTVEASSRCAGWREPVWVHYRYIKFRAGQQHGADCRGGPRCTCVQRRYIEQHHVGVSNKATGQHHGRQL
eukprot:TRINITY_DN43202_c0_g1_i1.p1 TRINITY_DN43202_c0_g1~~TRINITY_DN43202_c0_g1_i1.p1  ORF type:complete len:287 (+),score=51.29 TRINITY_DN43202_c0_g1_i1:90-950(+)